MKLSVKKRQEEGSCNHCQCRETEEVILIQSKTSSFTVCVPCFSDLLLKMKHLEKGKFNR